MFSSKEKLEIIRVNNKKQKSIKEFFKKEHTVWQINIFFQLLSSLVDIIYDVDINFCCKKVLLRSIWLFFLF